MYTKERKGFTLVELLIAMAIMLIIFTGAAALYYTSTQSTAAIWSDLEAQRNARALTQEFRNYVRRANIANNGAYPIEAASSSTLIFFADIDSDGLMERIHYEYTTSTVYRGITKPTGTPYIYDVNNEVIFPIARGIQNSANGMGIFSFFDENYTATGTALTEPVDVTSIRVVQLYVQVDDDPFSPPSSFDLSTAVDIRNLKRN